ncbi:SDR family oxidoreductase [Pseudomonas chlororaphis subsp. aurantiaca]|uniref:SDR family NAD(P)-dependent oxidoreductase n=1 Tax=Pseudomonas chlororaphis TaxID=587753 RepID=UPI0027DD1729|nr:SDR family oxidoreductase [Pseudomonas chlororaphis]WMI97604.1 SDR family oxidoreductase [Pseudomonas chlororaphis subsp. aurantiaca]
MKPFNPFSLEGKRVLVTGASSGLGYAIALGCAHMGAEVIVTGRNAERLSNTLAQLTAISSIDHRAVIGDITDPSDRAVLVESLGGEIHGLVHNAGTSRICSTRQMSEHHLGSLYKLNVEAPMLLTQAILWKKLMAAGGSILFISSIAAFIGVAGVGGYSGTKAALIAMARCLAVEVSKRRIRVNCMAPALVNTPLLELTRKATTSIDEQISSYPLGLGEPEDIANAAVFMLSGASRWITGTTLVLDGGVSIG